MRATNVTILKSNVSSKGINANDADALRVHDVQSIYTLERQEQIDYDAPSRIAKRRRTALYLYSGKYGETIFMYSLLMTPIEQPPDPRQHIDLSGADQDGPSNMDCE